MIADARKAIGGKKLDALKSLSVEGRRCSATSATFQMNADVELLFEMPDKYMRSDTPQGGMVSVGHDDGVQRRSAAEGRGVAGHRPRRRDGHPDGAGGRDARPTEKPTPEQQQQIDRAVVRSSRQELSRLMLGWFGAAHPVAERAATRTRERPSRRTARRT